MTHDVVLHRDSLAAIRALADGAAGGASGAPPHKEMLRGGASMPPGTAELPLEVDLDDLPTLDEILCTPIATRDFIGEGLHAKSK